MKRKFFTAAIIAFIVIVGTVVQSVNAQEKITPMSGITLTKEQRSNQKTLDSEIREKMEAVKVDEASGKISRKERNDKLKALQEDQHKRRKELFTPEQATQYDENLKAIEKQREEMRANKKK